MDPLDNKTVVNNEMASSPIKGDVVFCNRPDDFNTCTTFTRTICKTKNTTRQSVGSANQAMKEHIGSGCKRRNVTVNNIPSGNSEIAQPAQTSDPYFKHPKAVKIDTELPSPPVTNKLLIDSGAAVRSVLLQSYHPTSESQAIARPVHGLQHCCRTAIWALSILELRKLQHDPQALAFPDHMVPLLIKACLFHDTGREGDGEDTPEWERASADNLTEHLRNCGVGQSLAWQCGEAVFHKDNPLACQHLPEAIQTLRSLLHDADTLDVMRVRSCFYMNRLESFVACQEGHRKNWRSLAIESCKVIAGQGDLWCSIVLQDSVASDSTFFSYSAGMCENTKKQWEHHPLPLQHQLYSIGKQSSLIRALITPYTEQLAEPPKPPFSLATLIPCDTGTAEHQCSWQKGLYNDPVNQRYYVIRQTSCELSARNQLLMANLARLFGITVPDSFVHQEQGQFYVVSYVPDEWLSNLKGGKEALSSLSSEQWARLLLVNVIVGNENMVNSAWEGIDLTPEGEPVIFHWDFAGLATRYLPRDVPENSEPEAAARVDDFSSMPVLLKKLRDPRAPVMNSCPIKNPCVETLAQLDDDFLGHTLRNILGQIDWQSLDRLIEHSGFLAGDRSWLRQTIHDRIAWLTTRLPNSLEEGERVSMAEYKAIEAAGIRGGWLQVKGLDIRDGQVNISQLLDANDQPFTRMSLRLSRKAGNKLADSLGLEQGLHHLANKAAYINVALNANYRDWRSDLTSLASECYAVVEQLIHDKARWHTRDQKTIHQTTMTLLDVVIKCWTSLINDQPSIRLPEINIPLPAPAFPARVSSRNGEEAEALIQLAQFSHGFARLTGESARYLDDQHLDAAKLSASPVRRVKLKATACDGGSILFFPPNLPDALAFEHKLVITFPGHSKAVVEALFSELAELGIDGERPATHDLEERWLNSLADYHGCLGDMNRAVIANDNIPINTSKKKYLKEFLQLGGDDLLDWEVHCRIRAGRLVHYLPGLPHGIVKHPAQKFHSGHNLNFATDRQWNTEQVVTNSLHNEAGICSYGRRLDIGMEPCGNHGGMFERVNYDTNYVFTRIQADLPENEAKCKYGGSMSMVFKPEVLGRLDGSIFANHEHYFQPYPEQEAFVRNQKVIAKSAADYQRVVEGPRDQETRFAHPLSLLDELQILQMNSLKDQRHLLHTLKRRFSHWPDGRSVEELFRQTWSTYYYELIDEDSKVDKHIKQLIKLCGKQGLPLLFEQNPQLLEGRLNSLDGLKLTGSTDKIHQFDLTGCSMNGTVFESVQFRRCKLNVELLGSATVKDIFVCHCSFEGERIPPSVINEVRFRVDTDFDHYCIPESTHQLAQIIYQSCVNQQNEFNLNQWLNVMVRSDFLRYSSTPLDDLSQTILSQHMERIISDYSGHLIGIIYGAFDVHFKSVACATNFARTNPQFYDRKIKDLRDLYFDFRQHCLNKGAHFSARDNLERNLSSITSNVNNKFPKEAILELILNAINFALHLESDSEYIEFNAIGCSRHGPRDYWQSLSQEGNASTKNTTETCPEPINVRLHVASFLLGLERLQKYFHQVWKTCSEDSKLAIAKYCLSHHEVAVGHLTTVEFMRLLTKKQEGDQWLVHFVANMVKHRNIENERNLIIKEFYSGLSPRQKVAKKTMSEWITDTRR